MSERDNNSIEQYTANPQVVSLTPLQEADAMPPPSLRERTPTVSTSGERFRSLAMALATAQITWVTDAQGKVLEAPELLAFTGQTGAEVDAGNWHTYIHPEDQARVVAAWAEAVVSHTRFDAEYRLRKYDGTYAHFEVHGVPLFNPDGSIREWVGASANITPRKETEATVELLRERLSRSLMEMDHRVKNNLQVIAALLETQTPENSAMTLRRISHYTHALASLHDLLATAATASGVQTDFLSMRAILAELIPLLEVCAGQRHIAYQVEEILLPMQQIAAFAILVNELVLNAIQHGEGEIELTFEVKGDRALLEVCDDGPGFPADFDPHQAAKTGLQLVRSTGCHDLRGETFFTNRPEGGAKAACKFPLSQKVG